MAETRSERLASLASGPKILRIGILQSGKIVEERLVRKRTSVTLGQSAKNDFVVPASNALPRSFTLFELVSTGGYTLNFSDGMDGRISFGEQVTALSALRSSGKAAKRGELWSVPLTDRSRGKVIIGDVTVLFQFVAPPPVQPRPQLPPSVRSSLLQNLDWMLVAVVAASFFFHFSFVVYLRSVEWPRKPDIEEIPDRFVQMIVPKKVEEEKKLETVAKVEEKAEEKKDDKKKGGGDGKKAAAKAGPKDPEAEARAAAARRAEVANKVSQMGVLKLLGSKGEGGTLADLVKGGDVSGDADKVFASVGGVGVAGTGGGDGLRSAKGAGGTGSLRSGGSLRGTAVGEVGTGERGGERTVKAVVKESAPVDVDGSLDPSVIAREIRSRLGAVKACYESGLKRNPAIGGKIQLQFEISAVGKVTAAEIENDTMHDADVAACIKSKVMNWRFPAPPSGSVRFSYPFIFQASK